MAQPQAPEDPDPLITIKVVNATQRDGPLLAVAWHTRRSNVVMPTLFDNAAAVYGVADLDVFDREKTEFFYDPVKILQGGDGAVVPIVDQASLDAAIDIRRIFVIFGLPPAISAQERQRLALAYEIAAARGRPLQEYDDEEAGAAAGGGNEPAQNENQNMNVGDDNANVGDINVQQINLEEPNQEDEEVDPDIENLEMAPDDDDDEEDDEQQAAEPPPPVQNGIPDRQRRDAVREDEAENLGVGPPQDPNLNVDENVNVNANE